MNTAPLEIRLKAKEGTGPMKNGRHMPYRDSVGKLTIGYGRNLDDNGLSPDEAEYLLANDVDAAVYQVTQAFPWLSGMNDVRQRVIAELAFNMGLGDSHGGLLSFHNTLAAVMHGDYAAAADGMLTSLWAKQVKGRALELAQMMRTGADL